MRKSSRYVTVIVQIYNLLIVQKYYELMHMAVRCHAVRLKLCLIMYNSMHFHAISCHEAHIVQI